MKKWVRFFPKNKNDLLKKISKQLIRFSKERWWAKTITYL